MPNTPIVLPDRPSWLEFRRSHIGGSDISAILGANPFKGAYELWLEKTDQLDGNVEENEAMRWGKILEGPVADEYAIRTGQSLINPGPFTVRVHERLPFVAVTLDREIVNAERGPGVLECKTTNFFAGSTWDEGAPLHPQIQLQHGLCVTGWGWGALACLIGGQRFEPLDLERNPELIEMIEDRCEWFWDLVTRREAPPVDGLASTARALKQLHPKDNGETVELPPEARSWPIELAAVKASLKDLESRKVTLENQIRAAIGPATFGQLPDDGGKFSLKTTSVAGRTQVVEPYEFRKLHYLRPDAELGTRKRKPAKEKTP